MPQKLPRYVFRRSDGSYRYKRNVPKKLQPLIDKTTLYRKLGDSLQEALRNYSDVHAQMETILTEEKQTSSRERSLAFIRAALGDDVADRVMAKAVVEYSEEEYALNELAEHLHNKGVPMSIAKQVYNGQLDDLVISMDAALSEYAEYKSDSPTSQKEIEQRVERLRREMKAVFGAVKLREVPISDITRHDANNLRDHLLTKMSPNSCERNIGVIRAALNHVIIEHSLNIPNVFKSLKIKGAGKSRNDRLPVSDDQMQLLEPQFKSDETAWALFVTLRDTGARLAEISGLRVKDFDRQTSCIRIVETPWRRLKTHSSVRTIPVSEAVCGALSRSSEGRNEDDPIFPRFAKERGSDTASAMMMKRFRLAITERRVTLHSLRHRMKDELRNTGCPEDWTCTVSVPACCSF